MPLSPSWQLAEYLLLRFFKRRVHYIELRHLERQFPDINLLCNKNVMV